MRPVAPQAMGAVSQPMAPAALTAATTTPTAIAMRALRLMNSKTPNMAILPPDADTATQAERFIKVYKALIAIW